MSKHTKSVHLPCQLHMHHHSRKTSCRSNPGNQARRQYLHPIALLVLTLCCIRLLPRIMPWWAKLLQDVPYHNANMEGHTLKQEESMDPRPPEAALPVVDWKAPAPPVASRS
jgi:hypothetical protein